MLRSRGVNSIVSRVLKAEYVFRPTRLARRVTRMFRAPAQRGEHSLSLPWGWPFLADPTEEIGLAVSTLGIYDLVVCEALTRLLESGDRALDVGANIGLMTAVMAHAVGPHGSVTALEPHPELQARLRRNARIWRESFGSPKIECLQVAASDRKGSAHLNIPEAFESNSGLGSVSASAAGDRSIPIQLERLDDIVPEGTAIAVTKIDIEGHEIVALAGAQRLIESRALKHIIFEDHNVGRSEVVAHLRAHGYVVFALRRALFGPVLDSELLRQDSAPAWEAPSFIATLDASGTRTKLAARGWRVLRAMNPSEISVPT